jgi:deoxycytidylate deaminase
MEIKKQITYPYLPEGRTIKYVGLDNEYIKKAKEFSELKSTDRLQPTGSVVVKDGKIIGSAANVIPIKNPYFIEKHRKGLCLRKILKVKTGTKYWLCPGCAKFKDHSEQRSLINAKENGFDPKGADLFLYGHWWCCKPCWDKIIEAGIKDVYSLENSEVLFNSSNPANVLGKNFN